MEDGAFQKPVAVLTGPTACGKSQIAHTFARDRSSREEKIELINADSVSVYRGADIGSAKPSQLELSEVPYHLVSILDPSETFNAASFVRRVHQTAKDIHGRGHRALIVGGTGFYLKALQFGLWETSENTRSSTASNTDSNNDSDKNAIRQELETLSTEKLSSRLSAIDPRAAERIGPTDRYRLIRALEIFQTSGRTLSEIESTHSKEPRPDMEILIVDRPTADLHNRIEKRTRSMLEAGLIKETQRLLETAPESRILKAVGYKEVVSHLKGELPSGRKVKPGLEGLTEEIGLGTRQLVKQQRTWFRGQTHGTWFELEKEREALFGRLKEIYGS